MTRAETAELMWLINTMYPGNKISADAQTVAVWADMLADLPAEVVMTAAKRMGATLKFPPSIADIREAVTEAVNDAQGVQTAAEAWGEVVRAIHRYGYARPGEARQALGEGIWRAVQMVGGWQELCGSDEMGVISAQFERRYSAMVQQQSNMIQIPAIVRNDMARLVGPLMDKLDMDRRLRLGPGGEGIT